MTQGIRAYTNARFAKYLPQLAELGNAGFRAKVEKLFVVEELDPSAPR